MSYKVILKKNEERKILEGQVWVFANEVFQIEGKDKQGSIAKVYSFDNRFLAQGYINHKSKILVRILSTNENEIIDKNFFKAKIQSAWNMRQSLGYQNNCRVVFVEADGLPGLVVDKYSNYLSVQFLTLGMETIKSDIVECLVEIFKPLGIYERSDVQVREKEGLEQTKGLLFGQVPDKVKIVENDIKLYVDIINGQKTGYFLDQKENRACLKKYVSGKRVLDCFSHTGGFALNAKKYGASEVVACDISSHAIDNIKANALLNGFEITTKCADVFDYLRELNFNKEKFDVIVLNPPAFTKSSDQVDDALRGYMDINIQALKVLKKPGILFSCSCSHFISPNMFLEMLKKAGRKANVNIRLLEMRSQSADHSVSLNAEDSLYLKCAILYVE